jgi:hypothetical protein
MSVDFSKAPKLPGILSDGIGIGQPFALLGLPYHQGGAELTSNGPGVELSISFALPYNGPSVVCR